MISFDLNFFPREETRGEDVGQFDDGLSSFLGCLCRHGNVVGDPAMLDLEHCLQVRVQCLAPDALDEANLSDYARRYLKEVRVLSVRAPVFEQVREKTAAQTWCDCSSPSFRLLYSHWDRLVSPVLCGDCWRSLPLYRLPLLDDPSKEQHELSGWLDTRESLEQVWLHSSAGEREAYRQLARPNSPFMRETRDLAAQLESKTVVPTFAFLKHYYKKWGKHCPLCERKWKWKGPNKMRFRCLRCRLMSEEPTDYRTPLSQLHP